MSPDNQIGTRRARGVTGCAGRGKGEGQVTNGLVTVLRAADAAARWHVNSEVVQGLRGASDLLEQEFDRAAADAERTIPLAAEGG